MKQAATEHPKNAISSVPPPDSTALVTGGEFLHSTLKAIFKYRYIIPPAQISRIGNVNCSIAYLSRAHISVVAGVSPAIHAIPSKLAGTVLTVMTDTSFYLS